MAKELTIGANLRFTKLGKLVEFTFAGIKIDVAGGDYVKSTQIATTSAAAVNSGSITTAGYIAVKNNDSTNFVTLRYGAAGVDFVKLLPGDVALFRLFGTLYCIADTDSCEIEYLMVEA